MRGKLEDATPEEWARLDLFLNTLRELSFRTGIYLEADIDAETDEPILTLRVSQETHTEQVGQHLEWDRHRQAYRVMYGPRYQNPNEGIMTARSLWYEEKGSDLP